MYYILNHINCIKQEFKRDNNKKIIKKLAIVFTLLESIKIYFNISKGYIWINAWFPLSFCSIFIYALWLSGYCKGKLSSIGESFFIIASFTAGSVYLIFPSTALVLYPIEHSKKKA